MINLDNVNFYICHTSSCSPGREATYQELRTDMLSILKEFPGTTVELNSSEDLSLFKRSNPTMQVSKYIHSSVGMRDGTGRILGDANTGSLYSDIVFPYKLGEVGLLYSVYRTLSDFLKSDIEYLIWLEDDTVAEYGFNEKLSLYLNYIDFDFDIVSLGVLDSQLKSYSNVNYIGNKIFSKIYQLHWAGVLLISKSGAAEIVRYIETTGFKYPFDWLVFNIREQSDFESTIFNTYSLRPEFADVFNLDYEANSNSTIDYTYLFKDSDYDNKENMLLFDIGANRGDAVSAGLDLGYKVIALEPAPRVFSELVNNFIYNKDVIPLRLAVSETDNDTLEFYECVEDGLSTLEKSWLTDPSMPYYGKEFRTIKVRTCTMDWLVSQYGMPDLIKIDVEGAEWFVFRGMTKYYGELAFEWTQETLSDHDDQLKYLHSIGYTEFNMQFIEHHLARPNSSWYSIDPDGNNLNGIRASKAVNWERQGWKAAGLRPTSDVGMMWVR